MDSTASELLPIPEGWTYCRLGDLLQSNGLSYGIVQPGSDDPDGVPILRVKDLQSGEIKPGGVLRVSKSVEQQYRRSRLRGGEVLLSLVGSVGTVAVASASLSGWNVARAIAVIRPTEDISRWIKYYLSSDAAQHYMRMWQTTTVQATLNLRDVRRIPVPIPPSREREEIVNLLGAFDEKIRTNVAITQISSQLAAALFESAFEQRESVELARLGDLAEVIDCLHSQKPLFLEGGRRYLVLADIRDDSRLAPLPNFTISSDDYDNWTRRIEAREGDCLLTNVGRVGSVGQIPRGVTAAVGRNMTAIRGREHCPPAYLVEALRSGTVRREIDVNTDQGTVMSALNVRSIPNLLIPAGAVVDREDFQEQVGGLHELQDQLLLQNALLGMMRDTLLPRLMSGEIRVRDAERIVEDVT
jgi:type I restriction enzyme S subunit